MKRAARALVAMASVILLSGAGEPPHPNSQTDGFAEVTQSSSDPSDGCKYNFGVLQWREGSPDYWARKTIGSGRSARVQWADSRTCSAMIGQLQALQSLTPPTLAVPGLGEQPNQIILDGVHYQLRVRANYQDQASEITFDSNVGSPLADWVSGMGTAMEACWSDVAPRL